MASVSYPRSSQAGDRSGGVEGVAGTRPNRCSGFLVAVASWFRRRREDRATVRAFAHLDERSLRDLGVDPALYRCRLGLWRSFPFD